MIKSFSDRGTEDIFNRLRSKAARRTCPEPIWPTARRKLDQLNAAVSHESLSIPPGNRLEALREDRRGQHSIRIEEEMVRIPTHGPPTHPGEMLLEEFLKPLGMTQADLAQKIGVSYPRVNELIHGKRGVSPDTALRLEQLFGMEAQFWLNLQLAWDLYHLAHSAAANEIRKIKRLPNVTADACR